MNSIETADMPDSLLLAPALAALSHPVRIRILRHLCCNDECCCKEVVEQFDLAQSTVSQHLKILVDSGLVRFKAARPRSYYCIDRDALDALLHSVNTLFNSEASAASARGEQ